MDDDDMEFEEVFEPLPSVDLSWKAMVGFALMAGSTTLRTWGQFAEDSATTFLGAVNMDIDRKQFHTEAAMELEQIMNPED